MKQGIAGLVVGLVAGTVLASGAALALNTPSHDATTLGAFAAPTPITRSVATTIPAGGVEADGTHAVAVRHVKKATIVMKQRTARAVRTTSAPKHSASGTSVHHVEAAPAVHIRAHVDRATHEGNHEGENCD